MSRVWHRKWDDFLHSDSAVLSESNNVEQWVLDQWDDIETNAEGSLRSAVKEMAKSSGGSPEERAEQIVKKHRLDALFDLPGQGAALKILQIAAQKLGISLGEPDELEEVEEGPTWPLPDDMGPAEYMVGVATHQLEESLSRADALSKRVAGDVVEYLKTHFDEEEVEFPFMEEYYFKTMDVDVGVQFSVEIEKAIVGRPFVIDTGAHPHGEEPLIDIVMTFDARYPIVQSLEPIYFKVLEDVRHELEHLVSGESADKNDVSRAEYYIDKGEIPSLVRGLHLRAKKMKVPTQLMFKNELQQYIDSGEISPEQSEQILQVWNMELDRIQGRIR